MDTQSYFFSKHDLSHDWVVNGCTPNFCGGIQRYQDIFVSLKKNAKGFKPSQLPSTIFCCNLASTGFFCVDPNLIDVFFFTGCMCAFVIGCWHSAYGSVGFGCTTWGIMWEVVMYQSRFNSMEEPILAGVVKIQPNFGWWFLQDCVLLLLLGNSWCFFFCLKFQTSGWSFSVTGLNTSCSVNKPKWVRFEPQKWRLGRGFCFCDFESSYEMFQQQEDYGAKELSKSDKEWKTLGECPTSHLVKL